MSISPYFKLVNTHRNKVCRLNYIKGCQNEMCCKITKYIVDTLCSYFWFQDELNIKKFLYILNLRFRISCNCYLSSQFYLFNLIYSHFRFFLNCLPLYLSNFSFGFVDFQWQTPTDNCIPCDKFWRRNRESAALKKVQIVRYYVIEFDNGW